MVGDDLDDLLGVVHVKYAMSVPRDRRADVPVSAIMTEPLRVPETMTLDNLLSELRGKGYQLAVVIDEYGGTAGIITLEDVIEELVGDIDDEVDIEREDKTRRSAEDEPTLDEDEGDPVGPFLVSGRLNIDDADDDFKINLPKGGWDTVGGLVMDLAAGVPEVGDRVESEHYRFLVVAMDGRRIEEVEISLRVDEDDE